MLLISRSWEMRAKLICEYKAEVYKNAVRVYTSLVLLEVWFPLIPELINHGYLVNLVLEWEGLFYPDKCLFIISNV